MFRKITWKQEVLSLHKKKTQIVNNSYTDTFFSLQAMR